MTKSEYNAAWYIKNRERVRLNARIRRAADPEKKEKDRARYLKHREHAIAQKKDRRSLHPEIIRIKRHAYEAANRDKINRQRRQRYAEFPERDRAITQTYRNSHKEQCAKRAAEWHRTHRDKVRQYQKRHYRRHTSKILAIQTIRNRNRRLAMPPWVKLEQIAPFYDEARRLTRETGIQHSVDHCWPIKNERFSGLHVPWNLRVMTQEANLKKGNRAPDLQHA